MSGPSGPVSGDPGEARIRLGISACLLGQNVRYDGGHKLDHFLRDTLGRYVDYVPVCPEAECGLGIPREAMHLAGDPGAPRLVTVRTRIDHTGRMTAWGTRRLDDLATLDLDGYIFKSRSPSSGMERIKVHDETGAVISTKGTGIWARMFMERFPALPVEDEGRLHDPVIRETFIERIFTFKRWRDASARGMTLGGLVDFHTRHKYLVMAHGVQAYRELGRLVATGKGRDPDALYADYFARLAKALALRGTVKKHVNVLEHLAGYFKRDLTGDERREMAGIIGLYAAGNLPLIVPVTLINHYVRKYGQEYLAGQYYLIANPAELKLRTHV